MPMLIWAIPSFLLGKYEERVD